MWYNSGMRRLFRKYWYVILIVVIILALAVVVQYTKDTNDVARGVFNFLKEWAVILSAAGTFLLAGIAFWTIMRSRRSKIADEVHTWARGCLRLISSARNAPLTKEEYISMIQNRLRTIDSEAITMIMEAASLNNETVLKSLHSIISKCLKGVELESTMENQDEVYKKISHLSESIGEDLILIMHETS